MSPLATLSLSLFLSTPFSNSQSCIAILSLPFTRTRKHSSPLSLALFLFDIVLAGGSNPLSSNDLGKTVHPLAFKGGVFPPRKTTHAEDIHRIAPTVRLTRLPNNRRTEE